MPNGTTDTIISQGIVPLLAVGVLSETIRVSQGQRARLISKARKKTSKYRPNWLY